MYLAGQVLERLREDEILVLHRASRPGEAGTLLVAAAASHELAAIAAARLEHELELAALLQPDWAARPLALVQHEGRPALLLEDPGGRPAERLIGKLADLEQFLALAIGLASALKGLHGRGLIHKDIRPGNILVDGTSRVCLTGFGFAIRAPKETQRAVAPAAIAGTIAYMAPEQTGRMNRSIDARSDLYAAGMTLYEILVGSLPFAATDPMEWIHAHIARAPPPPSVRMEGIPPAIDAILLKLLAKNGEDRYQTAAGLEHDLQCCRAALLDRRPIELFALGEQDVSRRLVIPEKLYGREQEIETMLTAFAGVATGRGFDVLFVSGQPGIGKSSLINELRTRLGGTDALFAAAKCEMVRMVTPFATLASAFEGLLRQILCLDDASLANWRAVLAKALGNSAQLVIDIIPALGLIMGEHNSPPPLSAEEEKTRFQSTVRHFIGAFAKAEHPLVLIFDDLQWADPATIDLFELLCCYEEVPYLFLIGAFRTEGRDQAPGLDAALRRIAMARGNLLELQLSELTPKNMEVLVSDALRMDAAEAASLANFVHRRTRGNAFFAIQLLTALEIDGLLNFNNGERVWTWNVQDISDREAVRDIAELLTERLVRYAGVELDAIKCLACLGSGAPSSLIAAALDIPVHDVEIAMLGFVEANLVRLHEHGYAFVHDGVQEAAYALITDSEKCVLHLRTGYLLRQGLSGRNFDDRIFEIANQLNQGSSLINSTEEIQQLAEINLFAGKRAKVATAYSSAISYLSKGVELIQVNGWDVAYGTLFELNLNLADCQFATGEVERAEQCLTMLAARCNNSSDLATIVGRQMILYTHLGKIDYARSIAIEYLSNNGILFSPVPSNEDVLAEYKILCEKIADKSIDDLVTIPRLIDDRWRDCMDILLELLGPAGVLNSNLLDLLLLRMSNIGLTHGHCDAACHAYVNVGARTLGWRFGNFAAGRAFGRLALLLVEERGYDRYASRVYAIISGVLIPWMAPLRESFDIAFRAINMPRERGGIAYAGYAWVCAITALLDGGKNLGDVEQIALNGLATAKQTKFALAVELINAQLALVRALRLDGVDAANFHGTQMTRREYEAYLASGSHLWFALLRYNIRRLQFLFYFRFFEECLEVIEVLDRDFGEPPILGNTPVFEVVEYCLFSGLARAAILIERAVNEKNDVFVALQQSHAHFVSWAKLCPENFSCRAFLLAAEIARLESRDLEAQRLYDAAVRSARDHNFVQIEALANELAGRFYKARDFDVIAEAYVRNAHACYVHWGAEGKARELVRQYPYLDVGPSRSAKAGELVGAKLHNLDINTVIEMYQTLSSEIVLNKLIERLMIAVLEVAGADRGLLLLPRNGEMRVCAEAVTSEAGAVVQVLARSQPARDLSRSIVNYASHSREPVIIGDASETGIFSDDDYIANGTVQSTLCMPMMKQSNLVGILYLENHLSAHTFTPDRLVLLQILASQAAISIENAELFQDIQNARENARKVGEDFRRSLDMIPALAWRASPQGLLEFANKQWHDFTGISPAEARGMLWTSPFYILDQDKVAERWSHLSEFETSGEFEARMQNDEGEVRRFLVRAIPMRDDNGAVVSWHGTNTDIENLKRAEQAQDALARISRITAMGELTVSIAHEVNQPLMAIVTNAATCLRWLAEDRLNIPEARVAAERIIRHGHRAGEVIASIRALAKKTAPEPTQLNLNETVLEVLALTRNELDRHAIVVETDLASNSSVMGDRVQMQQVVLNLVMNGIEAMVVSRTRHRCLSIISKKVDDKDLVVTVSDTGIGLPDDKHIFDVFFTTKQDGIGIGLSICRSIVESHRGRIWASPNKSAGTSFHFTIPIYQGERA